MTFEEKHPIGGLGQYNFLEVMPADFINFILLEAGYAVFGTFPGNKRNRICYVLIHEVYSDLLVVYNPAENLVITAYHDKNKIYKKGNPNHSKWRRLCNET